MTEPTTEGGLSLLPYLEGRKPGLRLTLTDLAASSPQTPRGAAPEALGPFTTLRNARVTLDGIHVLSEVFLLIQPDHYTQTPSEQVPFTNPQVEALWQGIAGRLKAQGEGEGRPLLLPGQTDAKGNLIPLRPLCYCRHRQRFGHALCPQCGGALTLCRDDQMLQAAGLETCSDSLMRYLFCPSCQGRKLFYAREAPAQAPGHLRDARQLMEDFSRLLGKEALADELPCIGCPETAACYGAQTLVHQRMAPLCFYPFHMLMLPAPAIWSDHLFKLWLRDLRREIQDLLPGAPVATAAPPAQQPAVAPDREAVAGKGTDEEDARIAAILRTILSQWPDEGSLAQKKASAAPPRKLPATPPADPDGDSLETVILGAAPQTATPAKPVAPPPAPDMEKTVLIQRPPAGTVKPTPPEDLQATVLISPVPNSAAPPPAAEDLEKTVLMGAPSAAPKAAADDDDLAQTVLMTPPAQSTRPPQAPAPTPPKTPPAPPKPPQSDELAETVIISPGPGKGRPKL